MDWAVMRLNGSDRPLEGEKTGPSAELYDTKENISCMLSDPSFSIYHLQNTTIQMSDLGKKSLIFYIQYCLWETWTMNRISQPSAPAPI